MRHGIPYSSLHVCTGFPEDNTVSIFKSHRTAPEECCNRFNLGRSHQLKDETRSGLVNLVDLRTHSELFIHSDDPYEFKTMALSPPEVQGFLSLENLFYYQPASQPVIREWQYAETFKSHDSNPRSAFEASCRQDLTAKEEFYDPISKHYWKRYA